jgi:hypothetical protein
LSFPVSNRLSGTSGQSVAWSGSDTHGPLQRHILVVVVVGSFGRLLSKRVDNTSALNDQSLSSAVQMPYSFLDLILSCVATCKEALDHWVVLDLRLQLSNECQSRTRRTPLTLACKLALTSGSWSIVNLFSCRAASKSSPCVEPKDSWLELEPLIKCQQILFNNVAK